MNKTLFKYELKKSLFLLLIFISILTLYITLIICMYNEEMGEVLKKLEELMPGIMSIFGMNGPQDTLLNFMSSYLYGMIMLVFPMVFTFIRCNSLIIKYLDNKNMGILLSSPNKRSKILITQYANLILNLFIIIFYCTILEIIVSEIAFKGELEIINLLYLNFGLLVFQIFIASLTFLCSCLFEDSKYSLSFGVGIPTLMYVLQMLANMKGNLENIKYITFFSLYQPYQYINFEWFSFISLFILILFSGLFLIVSLYVFKKRDLNL